MADTQRYYNGPWSPTKGDLTSPVQLTAFRMFDEGMLPSDYWRVTKTSGSTFDDINAQYRAGRLTIKRTVYASSDDYSNDAYWQS